jgi:hemerythrin
MTTGSLWKEKYRIGIEKLDQEHMAMCARMSDLVRALEEDNARTAVDSLLGRFYDQLKQHLHDEENHLADVKCPDLDVHAQEHRAVLKTFEKTFEKWEMWLDSPGGDQVLIDLGNWLLAELLTSDVRMRDYLVGYKE